MFHAAITWIQSCFLLCAHGTQEPWQSSLQVSGCAWASQHFRQSVGTAQLGTASRTQGHHTQQGQARGSSSV